MTREELIQKIEDEGYYTDVEIDGNFVTGMLVAENYEYDEDSNTGGRRNIGAYGDRFLMCQYE